MPRQPGSGRSRTASRQATGRPRPPEAERGPAAPHLRGHHGCAAPGPRVLPGRYAPRRGHDHDDDHDAVLPADLHMALDRVADALTAMFTGDPAPYAALWAPGTQPTLFGAWGPTEKGHDAVVTHLRLGRLAVLRRHRVPPALRGRRLERRPRLHRRPRGGRGPRRRRPAGADDPARHPCASARSMASGGSCTAMPTIPRGPATLNTGRARRQARARGMTAACVGSSRAWLSRWRVRRHGARLAIISA